MVMVCGPSLSGGSGAQHLAGVGCQQGHARAAHGDCESGRKAGTLQSDRAAVDRDARRAHRVSVEHMGVVVEIGAAVAAEISDANDEAVRTQDLRIETAHAESCRVERSRSESRRSRALRIAQGPYANHRCGFRFAGRASFIQRGDGYRQGAIGLRGDREVADIAVAAQRADPIARRREPQLERSRSLSQPTEGPPARCRT